jgi:hypothetical protein
MELGNNTIALYKSIVLGLLKLEQLNGIGNIENSL